MSPRCGRAGGIDVALHTLEICSGVGMLGEGLRSMKPIPGFAGVYSITSDGRVFSHRSNKFLKPSKAGRYQHVMLGSAQCRKVHELVLLAFHGARPLGHVGRHRNGNSHDNSVKNLEWSTQSVNCLDKNAHGTMLKGASHPMKKLSAKQVDELRSLRLVGGLSYVALGQKFGISKSQAHRIVSGENWNG